MKNEPQIVRRPLYRQVMDGIRVLLQEKRPNDRVGTEAEFAKRFGVSVVTVRQAMQRLESEGVIERRQGSGTFVPEVRIPSRHVGVLLDADPTHPRLSPYFPKLVQKLRAALTAKGIANRAYYGMVLAENGMGNGELSCQDVLDDARLDRLNGLICFHTMRHPSWTEVMEARKIPIIDWAFLWERGGFSKTDFIHAALAHLKEKQKRRVAVLASENPLFPIQAKFLEGLKTLAPQYGIEVDTALVDITASAWEVGMGWERFRELWRTGADRPDALILENDMLFSDCQKAILELRIPVPSALEIIVKSSDAVDLHPQFPIQVYRTSTQRVARWYADMMGALLGGGELPSVNESISASLTLEGAPDTSEEEALFPAQI